MKNLKRMTPFDFAVLLYRFGLAHEERSALLAVVGQLQHQAFVYGVAVGVGSLGAVIALARAIGALLT